MLFKVYGHTNKHGHFYGYHEADSADAARIQVKREFARDHKIRPSAVSIICVEEVKRQ